MKIESVSFIGLGLIGGSVAKAIKKYHPEINIYTRASENTVKKAYELGISNNALPLAPEDLAKSDVVFLCCPVDVNIFYLEILKDHITNTTIITDVGSVKGDIHRAVNRLDLNNRFVGGHPMAGSDKTGLDYSSPDLIKGCRYCLTTHDGKSNKNSRLLANFLISLKVRTKLLSFEEHDKSAAAISHIPHITASALCNFVESHDRSGIMRDMLATGFKDSTRIAKGSPDIWQQILSANSDAILPLLDDYIDVITELRDSLSNKDSQKIYKFFQTGKRYREKLD